MVDSGTFKTTFTHQSSPYFESAKMNVLLSNSDKSNSPAANRNRLSIDPSRDLGKLDICFGGFSPTIMDGDITRLRGLAEAAERRDAERKAANEHAAAIEAARASEEREYTDSNGSTWRYVVLDDSEVRISKCSSPANEHLQIPDEIEGKPVVALAADSCSDLECITSITMPNTVVAVGYSAFRDCSELLSIEFSEGVSKFDSGWLRGCHKLQRLKLPGKIEKITSAVFDASALRELVIGNATAEVMPGAFAKSNLASIEVHPDNPYMMTDGKAIYSKDGSIMVVLAVPCSEYEILDGCKALAKKAFSSFEAVEEIVFPETLQVISDFALTRTSIRLFKAPSALKAIGERAFYACRELRAVILNEGLEFIEANAFSDTAISELRLPSSILEFGNPIADGTSLTYSGPDASFSIDKSQSGSSQYLELDETGALYCNAEDGLHLVKMLEPSSTECVVREGTVAIDGNAFAKHPNIVEVILPSTLKSIGKGAFKDARNLAIADMPDSIEVIGEEAFLDTCLQSFRIPANLARIGAIALVTYGAHHGNKEPSLRFIEVDPQNPRFYMSSGLLIERMDGLERVILCTGGEPDVVIPDSVTAIAPYAFHGVRTLRTLTMSDKITMIEIRGLAFDSLVDNIHVNLAQPIDGHAFFDFKFPKTTRAVQQMGHAFGTPNFVNVEGIFDHYDNTIVNRSGFDSRTEGTQLTAYEQGRRIIERLQDPVLMSNTNRGLMDSVLNSHLNEICVDAARHDDKSIIEGLLDLGYITQDNIDDVIDAVAAVQDASLTNYLLEQKRQRYGAETIDFSL